MYLLIEQFKLSPAHGRAFQGLATSLLEGNLTSSLVPVVLKDYQILTTCVFPEFQLFSHAWVCLLWRFPMTNIKGCWWRAQEGADQMQWFLRNRSTYFPFHVSISVTVHACQVVHLDHNVLVPPNHFSVAVLIPNRLPCGSVLNVMKDFGHHNWKANIVSPYSYSPSTPQPMFPSQTIFVWDPCCIGCESFCAQWWGMHGRADWHILHHVLNESWPYPQIIDWLFRQSCPTLPEYFLPSPCLAGVSNNSGMDTPETHGSICPSGTAFQGCQPFANRWFVQ
jgi:hypothetical protein